MLDTYQKVAGDAANSARKSARRANEDAPGSVFAAKAEKEYRLANSYFVRTLGASTQDKAILALDARRAAHRAATAAQYAVTMF